ncbi:zinc finger protein zat5 [Phtheirospermum japonicum]|uniref:Zinc finger protein zat5 n=1 Tax=Phtheirospermum japonicum TaxID=374723 RepID=A0A830C0Y3_9LAMI|nr:zinc finger protein zat5 [Phtheirospermum japonicum]
MDTEAVEDIVAAHPPSCLNKDISPIAKGKRTKRQRPLSPIPFSAAWSEESTTTEEEDTARCLILLARGHFPIIHSKRKRHEETAAACMYECKTCNRVFQSFQALGGHRASHKKPKYEKKSALFSDEEDYPSPSTMGSFKKRMSPSSLQLANISAANAATAAATCGGPMKPLPSPRIHECSYCGAEFTSGQALGGHMRRHRAGPIISSSSNPATASIVEAEPNKPKKPRNGLSLDLNLPAPEDENQRFGFADRHQKSPVISTSNTPTLVDCHY